MTAVQDPPARPQTFRSPFAVAIWWLWAAFAVGNLIDLAVQGRDHGTVVAAFVLLLITGVVYTAAQRPRIVAGSDALTIANPLRDHRVVWPAVAAVDAAELVRVRCVWPAAGGADAAATSSRVIYSWAVHSSRRKEAAARMRAARQAGRRGAGRSFGGFGAPRDARPVPPAPTAGDAGHVVTTLTALAGERTAADPRQPAAAPVSSWNWPAIAAIVVPALALVIAIFA